jgi:hypothetical protein
LRQSGALTRGEITSVDITDTGAFNSQTGHLLVCYSADAVPQLPTHLILKLNVQTAWGREAGRDEVRFYQNLATFPDHPSVIPPCLATAYDEASEDSYLIMQDLSLTHRHPITRDQTIGLIESVPTAEDMTACVDTLAHFHAYWWNHPLMLSSDHYTVGYWFYNAECLEAYLKKRRASWQKLLATDGAFLSDDLRTLYTSVLNQLPNFWQQHFIPV